MKTYRVPHSKIEEKEGSSELLFYLTTVLKQHGFDTSKEIIVWTDYLACEEVFEQEDEQCQQH